MKDYRKKNKDMQYMQSTRIGEGGIVVREVITNVLYMYGMGGRLLNAVKTFTKI